MPTSGARSAQEAGADQVLQRAIAIAELISAVAYEAPVAVLIDDLHWADAASVRVLQAVQSRVRTSRALLVITTRPHRDQVRESGDVTVLSLAPLSLAEVGVLVSSIARPPAGPDGEFLITTLWRASGGSPLHVLEAVQQVLDAGHLALKDSAWNIVDLNRLVHEVSRGESIAGRIKSLDRPASYLLTLLATAGVPCSTTLLTHAAARESSGLTEALARLERRGFITQVRGEWEPAHDEIAEAALEVAEPATRQAAARALGEALVSTGPCDALVLRRSLQLLLEGGATDRLAPVLLEHAPADFLPPDQARKREVVAELVGLAPDDAVVEEVLAGLPTPSRRVRTVGWVAAVALMAVALGQIAWPASEDAGTAPAMVAITLAPDGRTEVRQAVIHPREITGHGPLSLGRRVHLLPDMQIGIRYGDFALSPKGWAFIHAPLVDNRRTNDIARVTASGTAFLTTEARDDISPRVSPDRAWIAYASSQWSPRTADDLDIALMDSLGGSLRRLTSGPASDFNPTWDHSGTRIAFIRKHRVIRPDELCVITMEGTLLACLPLEGFGPDAIGGWLNANSVVLQGLDDNGHRAMRLDLRTGLLERFLPGSSLDVQLSPNARWTLCRCDLAESEEPEWHLIPTHDPAGARPIELPTDHRMVLLTWNSAGPAPEQMIHSLRIASAPASIPLATTYKPRAETLNANGTVVPIPPGVLRWWSADPSIARVDSATGTVTPQREGTTSIHATAGGSREASTSVTIRGGPHTVALDETWREVSPLRWRGYGDPKPRLATGPEGVRGLVPNGDGSHPSGLYSVAWWEADGGIGVDAEVSTPIDRTIWQNLGLALAPVVHDALLAAWDHLDGLPPATLERGAGQCAVGYPSGEGATSVERVALAAAGQSQLLRVASELRAGGWWRIRLQIFPDGSCGVAVNGIPIWRSLPRIALENRFRIWLTGHAMGTEPMFGRLTVWTGVGPDVDWAALDSLPPT